MEIVAATKPSHAHKFEIKGNRGYCPCGEIREYSYEDNIAKNGVKVIQAGRTGQDAQDGSGRRGEAVCEDLLQTIFPDQRPGVHLCLLSADPAG